MGAYEYRQLCDLDGGFDVDHKDYYLFAGCMTNPGVYYSSGCAATGHDIDGDCDQGNRILT